MTVLNPGARSDVSQAPAQGADGALLALPVPQRREAGQDAAAGTIPPLVVAAVAQDLPHLCLHAKVKLWTQGATELGLCLVLLLLSLSQKWSTSLVRFEVQVLLRLVKVCLVLELITLTRNLTTL